MTRRNIAASYALLLSLLIGCGESTIDPGPDLAADVSGLWTFEVEVTDVTGAACAGEVGATWTSGALIEQAGSNVTATGLWSSDDGAHELIGSRSGNTVTLAGAYPEDGGTTAVTHTLMVSGDGTMMTGSEAWTWTDGVNSCIGGVSSVTASR